METILRASAPVPSVLNRPVPIPSGTGLGVGAGGFDAISGLLGRALSTIEAEACGFWSSLENAAQFKCPDFARSICEQGGGCSKVLEEKLVSLCQAGISSLTGFLTSYCFNQPGGITKGKQKVDPPLPLVGRRILGPPLPTDAIAATACTTCAVMEE